MKNRTLLEKEIILKIKKSSNEDFLKLWELLDSDELPKSIRPSIKYCGYVCKEEPLEIFKECMSAMIDNSGKKLDKFTKSDKCKKAHIKWLEEDNKFTTLNKR